MGVGALALRGCLMGLWCGEALLFYGYQVDDLLYERSGWRGSPVEFKLVLCGVAMFICEGWLIFLLAEWFCF